MVDEIGKLIKIDDNEIDQNVESDKELIFLKLRDENLAQNLENLNIDQKSKQSELSVLLIFYLITLNRFFKHVSKSNYAKLNNSNYKFRDRDDQKRNTVKKNNRIFNAN